MMPVPAMLGSQLVHKPPEAKLLAIHSAHSQPQATPQHNYQQPNHMQQQHQQQQQSKPGSFFILVFLHPVSLTRLKLIKSDRKNEMVLR